MPRLGGVPVRGLASSGAVLVACAAPLPEPPPGMARLPEGCEATEHGTACTNLTFLDLEPVSNDQYAEFVQGQPHPPPVHCCDPTRTVWRGGAPPPEALDAPVVNVRWREADAYCVWSGKRLPTEAEWVRAVRTGVVETAAVREWVGDRFADLAWEGAMDPGGPWSDTCCVVLDPSGARAQVVDGPLPELSEIGFRCASRPGEATAPYPRGRVASGLKLVGTVGSYRFEAPDGTRPIPGPFDDALVFSEGVDRTWVKRPGQDTWDLIDPEGSAVATTRFRDVQPFSEGLARVGHGTDAAIAGAPFGWVDRDGREVQAPRWAWASGFAPSGVAVVLDPETRHWGMIERDGTWRVPPRFAGLGYLAGGRAPALLDPDAGRWGFVDARGDVLPPDPPSALDLALPEGPCAGLHPLLSRAGPRAADLWIGVEPAEGPAHVEWRIRRYAGGASAATRIAPGRRVTTWWIPGLAAADASVLAEACAPGATVTAGPDGARIREVADPG